MVDSFASAAGVSKLRQPDDHDRGDTLHWYLVTTDGGSNEMGARRIIHTDVKDLENVFFSDTTCLEHSQHLVSLSGLKAADRCLAKKTDWGYYSSLATCSNVCRDVGQQMFSEWTDAFGLTSAKGMVKTLWPKACSGRWSGCDKPESRFLKCGKQRLEPIMEKILTKGVAKKTSASSVSIDELAIEESKAYSEKMTKWKRRALTCLKDPLWWRCLEVMHEVRAPLSHLSNFLHQKQGQERFGHVAQLCTGKSTAIYEEFSEVWPKLVRSGCLKGTDGESQFIRNFALLVIVGPHQFFVMGIYLYQWFGFETNV